MQDLNDLYYYVQVVEQGSFAGAGRLLGIPKSRLSRRIAQLEENLGVRLIQRSTRRFEVTDIGRTYYEHCKAMLVEAEAAQEVIDQARAEPSGVVRVSCPITLLQYRMAELVADFMLACPRVTVLLEASNRQVDVIAEKFDVALRVRFPPLQDSDLAMRFLADSPQRLVASPELLAQYPALTRPEQLSALPGLGWMSSEAFWSLEQPGSEPITVGYTPRYVTDDMTALRLAALKGAGIVQLPQMVVDDDLASGRLQDALPGWAPPAGVVHAIFPSRRGQLPAVRALIDYLAEHTQV